MFTPWGTKPTAAELLAPYRPPLKVELKHSTALAAGIARNGKFYLLLKNE
jgi:hypothetical protein